MTKLLTLIKHEVKTKTPCPVIEFALLFIFNLIFTLAFSHITSNTIYIERARVSFQNTSLFVWAESYYSSVFLIYLVVPILISISLASDYEAGLTQSIILLPIKRSEYLMSKILYYTCLFVFAFQFSNMVTWWFTPFKIPYFEFLLVVLFSIGLILFWVSISSFIALLTKKMMISVVISFVSAILLSTTLSYSQPPLVYITNPFKILLSGKYLEGVLWCCLFHFGISIILTGIMFYQFNIHDVKEGSN